MNRILKETEDDLKTLLLPQKLATLLNDPDIAAEFDRYIELKMILIFMGAAEGVGNRKILKILQE